MASFHHHLLAVVGAAVLHVAAGATPLYNLTDLGPHHSPGHNNASEPRIGRAGVVAMTMERNPDRHETPKEAVLYRNGNRKQLGTLGGGVSYAYGINRHGDVVGTAATADAAQGHHAFVWSKGVMQDLGTLGGGWSVAEAINNKGEVVGDSEPAGQFSGRPFLYSGGVMTQLPGPAWTKAYDINDHSEITGAVDGGDGYSRAYRYRVGGTSTILGNLGAGGSSGAAINNRGDIVGQAGVTRSPDANRAHAVLFQGETAIDLGTLGGRNSRAFDINDDGLIVGSSELSETDPLYPPNTRAFIYKDGQMMALQDMVDPASGAGWTLWAATGISNEGYIVGWGVRDGQRRRYLLTPLSAR